MKVAINKNIERVICQTIPSPPIATLTSITTGEVKGIVCGDFNYDGIEDFVVFVAPPKDKKTLIATTYYLNMTAKPLVLSTIKTKFSIPP